MSQSLADRHVLITGGSHGIGFACAKECLDRGASVTIVARNADSLEEARRTLTTASSEARVAAERCDVSDEAQVLRLFEGIAKRGKLDGVVHAAAILGPIGNSLDVKPLAWWETVQTNLFGTFLVVRASAGLMRESGGGRIVAFSGGGAASPFPNYTAYAVSKVAVVRFVETVAIEFAPFGIEINALAPGFVATRIHAETLAAGPVAAGAAFFENTKAVVDGGGVSPQLGAAAAAFLISPAAKGITGKLVAAQWDGYEQWSDHLSELTDGDLFTLRRILPKDRGLDWQ